MALANERARVYCLG